MGTMLAALCGAGLADDAGGDGPPAGDTTETQQDARAAGEQAEVPAEDVAPADPNWLDAVIVTATRDQLRMFESPFAADVVDMSGVGGDRLPGTLTEALGEVPGTMIQKTSNAQGSPYIRGFTSFRTLMMVDGIRLNNSIFRPGPNQYWNLVDPFTVDRLEVIKGPGSVLYGSDAIGGTVNAMHKRPPKEVEGKDWFGLFATRISTAERAYAARGRAGLVHGPWAIQIGGTWRDFGDIDGGGGVGIQSHTGYGVYSGDVRVEYRPDADTTWTFAHYQLFKDDAWRQHKTIYGISWQDTTVGNELARILDEGRSLTYGRFRRENMGGFIDAVELTASLQYIRERRFRLRNDGRADEQGVDVHTYGIGAQFTSPTAIGTLTYGLEWYHDEVQSFRRDYNADGSLNRIRIQGPVGDDASYDLLGVYLQNVIPLGDRVELTVGGRYTYAKARAGQVQDPDTGNQISLEDDWNAFVGAGRISWFVDPEEHWNVWGGVSQAFRAPNLSDLSRLDTARSNEIETAAPGLDPERYLTWEVGVKTDYENVSAQASYYYTMIDDMILRTPTGNVIGGSNEVTKKNVGDGFVHGVEVAGQVRVHPQWTVYGKAAWLDGEVDTFPTSAPVKESEPLSRLMPTKGEAGVRWTHPDERFWAQLGTRFACHADQLSTRDKGDTQRIPPGGTPGYFVMDLRGGMKVTEQIDLWAAVENFTNESYRIHGSGVNEPGINFIFGMQWRF
jgi:hemoglobin/transferrin/lactoferrin receptor protein